MVRHTVLYLRSPVCVFHLIPGCSQLTRPPAFEPPAHRSGMRALLEHSRQTYGPLSAELRRIRSRTSSRPSPYPQPQRAIKISLSPSAVRPEVHTVAAPKPTQAPVLSVKPAPTFASQPLQDRIIKNTVTTTTTNVSASASEKNAKSDSGRLSQSRFSSNARRSAPGFTKRGTGKENQERDSSSGIMTACVPLAAINCSLLIMIYRPNESLRLNRPRPRGRPAHARAALPTRI
jgi:serine/arginine repetitive matrix protein 2